MNLVDRIVTSLPMHQLWTAAEELRGSRMAYASAADITNLLRKSTVFFVIADVGHKLHWVDEAQRFAFWQNEAQMHLAGNTTSEPTTFPDGYTYVASIWSGTDTAPIVLLEKYY